MKIIIAADLHLCVNISREMQKTTALLPEGFFGPVKKERWYWHNEMLVERMRKMMGALGRIIVHERPDLCVFLGDMVNTNWANNVSGFKKELAAFQCPTAMVSGNHDIYLDAQECRLEKVFGIELGMRHMLIDKLGLVFWDTFIKRDGKYFPSLGNERTGGVEYRPEDLRKTLALLEQNKEKDFLILGHFPICEPDKRIQAEGRKMMRNFRLEAMIFLEELQKKENFLGFIAGHQHFNHLQFLRRGFHWTLPSLCEYPCACAILEIRHGVVHGRLEVVDASVAKASLGSGGEKWPYGSEKERCFEYNLNSPVR
ncbi:MAG: metallophosphoesterase [Kiritimatiellae bacterium]|nr:metallophosphoesterase [Kiritimatiellia bacterium]